MAFGGPIQLNTIQDESWIIAALADVDRTLSERAVMLEAAMQLRKSGVELVDHIQSLRPLVGNVVELAAVLDARLVPFAENQERKRMEANAAKRKSEFERKDAKAYASWVLLWREIVADPDAAFSPERSSQTAWNLWRAMDQSEENSSTSGWSRRFIELNFGKGVADRLRSALASTWRNDRPTLRSERTPEGKNTYLVKWQVGLAGIAAESEDPQWARALTPDEAKLAASYAPIEVSGFPAWLSR